MRRIDELHLEHPVRRQPHAARPARRREAFEVGRRHVRHADAPHGHRGAVPQAEHQQDAPGAHGLSRTCCAGSAIERPNQVWAMDITYIPMARGFVYLAAVVDWCSRRVLAHRRVDHAGGRLLRRGGARRRSPATAQPEIVNTDQGSQFTGDGVHRACCTSTGIEISMDGKGCWRDNVFVERLWRSDQVRGGLPACLRQRQRGARRHLERYIDFYNTAAAAFSSLGKRTPDERYFATLPATQQGSMSGAPTSCPPRRSCVRRKRRPPAAVDNSATASTTRQRSTYRSHFRVQTTGATSLRQSSGGRPSWEPSWRRMHF